MTKRSHSIYFDRMINFSLLIQNGDVWGELGKYLILLNIDYFEKSFCINPNTLSCLCFEIAQWKLSNFFCGGSLQSQQYQDSLFQSQETNP